MRKVVIIIRWALFVLLGFVPMSASAETGNTCVVPEKPLNWYGTLKNELDLPIEIRIPRNEWQCADWRGVNTPAILDGVVLQPGEQKQFVLGLNVLATQWSVAPFTMQVRYKLSNSMYVVHNERVGLNDISSMSAAYLYVYNPNQWVYKNSPPVDQGDIVVRGKVSTIRYTSTDKVIGQDLQVGGIVAFRYR
jgi:hypothetical protein